MNSYLRKTISWMVLVSFLMQGILPPQARAQSVSLPAVLPAPVLSHSYHPAILKGMTIDPAHPLSFDFIVDSGDDNITGKELEAESMKLVKYFLASLTTPEKDLWVNLSPSEPERIIPGAFGKTEMGRDLLAQDYLLKQLTASLLSPDQSVGKNFWKDIEAKLKDQGIDVPVDLAHKVWIVPERSEIYVKDNHVFIVDSHLKVMLEDEYRALGGNSDGKNAWSTDLIRQEVLPAIEKEVNEGKTFANLRQIFNSLILAVWYKKHLKESIINQQYSDQQKTDGLNPLDDKSVDQIYAQYLNAFKSGVYDLMKEEYNPQSQEVISKKYFTGGVDAAAVASTMVDSAQLPFISVAGGLQNIKIELSSKQDTAMTNERPQRYVERLQNIQMIADTLLQVNPSVPPERLVDPFLDSLKSLINQDEILLYQDILKDVYYRQKAPTFLAVSSRQQELLFYAAMRLVQPQFSRRAVIFTAARSAFGLMAPRSATILVESLPKIVAALDRKFLPKMEDPIDRLTRSILDPYHPEIPYGPRTILAAQLADRLRFETERKFFTEFSAAYFPQLLALYKKAQALAKEEWPAAQLRAESYEQERQQWNANNFLKAKQNEAAFEAWAVKYSSQAALDTPSFSLESLTEKIYFRLLKKELDNPQSFVSGIRKLLHPVGKLTQDIYQFVESIPPEEFNQIYEAVQHSIRYDIEFHPADIPDFVYRQLQAGVSEKEKSLPSDIKDKKEELAKIEQSEAYQKGSRAAKRSEGFVPILPGWREALNRAEELRREIDQEEIPLQNLRQSQQQGMNLNTRLKEFLTKGLFNLDSTKPDPAMSSDGKNREGETIDSLWEKFEKEEKSALFHLETAIVELREQDLHAKTEVRNPRIVLKDNFEYQNKSLDDPNKPLRKILSHPDRQVILGKLVNYWRYTGARQKLKEIFANDFDRHAVIEELLKFIHRRSAYLQDLQRKLQGEDRDKYKNEERYIPNDISSITAASQFIEKLRSLPSPRSDAAMATEGAPVSFTIFASDYLNKISIGELEKNKIMEIIRKLDLPRQRSDFIENVLETARKMMALEVPAQTNEIEAALLFLDVQALPKGKLIAGVIRDIYPLIKQGVGEFNILDLIKTVRADYIRHFNISYITPRQNRSFNNEAFEKIAAEFLATQKLEQGQRDFYMKTIKAFTAFNHTEYSAKTTLHLIKAIRNQRPVTAEKAQNFLQNHAVEGEMEGKKIADSVRSIVSFITDTKYGFNVVHLLNIVYETYRERGFDQAQLPDAPGGSEEQRARLEDAQKPFHNSALRQRIQNVLIYQPYLYQLGTDVLENSLLLNSIRQTFPQLKHLKVVTRYPQLYRHERMVETIDASTLNDGDFTALKDAGEPDLIISVERHPLIRQRVAEAFPQSLLLEYSINTASALWMGETQKWRSGEVIDRNMGIRDRIISALNDAGFETQQSGDYLDPAPFKEHGREIISEKLQKTPGGPVIVLNPFANFFDYLDFTDVWIKLLKSLKDINKNEILMMSGTPGSDQHQILIGKLKKKAALAGINLDDYLLKPLDPVELASVISATDYLVTIQTGPAHLAEALGTPTVVWSLNKRGDGFMHASEAKWRHIVTGDPGTYKSQDVDEVVQRTLNELRTLGAQIDAAQSSGGSEDPAMAQEKASSQNASGAHDGGNAISENLTLEEKLHVIDDTGRQLNEILEGPLEDREPLMRGLMREIARAMPANRAGMIESLKVDYNNRPVRIKGEQVYMALALFILSRFEKGEMASAIEHLAPLVDRYNERKLSPYLNLPTLFAKALNPIFRKASDSFQSLSLKLQDLPLEIAVESTALQIVLVVAHLRSASYGGDMPDDVVLSTSHVDFLSKILENDHNGISKAATFAAESAITKAAMYFVPLSTARYGPDEGYITIYDSEEAFSDIYRIYRSHAPLITALVDKYYPEGFTGDPVFIGLECGFFGEVENELNEARVQEGLSPFNLPWDHILFPFQLSESDERERQEIIKAWGRYYNSDVIKKYVKNFRVVWSQWQADAMTKEAAMIDQAGDSWQSMRFDTPAKIDLPDGEAVSLTFKDGVNGELWVKREGDLLKYFWQSDDMEEPIFGEDKDVFLENNSSDRLLRLQMAFDQLLLTPDIEEEVQFKSSDFQSAASYHGGRKTQEDRFIDTRIDLPGIPHGQGRLMAVMDGHGGSDWTAELIRQNIAHIFTEVLRENSRLLPEAMKETVKELGEIVRQQISGSTLSMVYIPDDESRAYVGILGDSPVIISDDAGNVNVSPLHSSYTNAQERLEAIARGGKLYFVEEDVDRKFPRIANIKAGLHASALRDLGSAQWEGIFSNEPEVYAVPLGPESFVLLATDGIFENVSLDTKKLGAYLKDAIIHKKADAKAIVYDAFFRGSDDNITAVLYYPKADLAMDAGQQSSTKNEIKRLIVLAEKSSQVGLTEDAQNRWYDILRVLAKANIPKAERDALLQSTVKSLIAYFPDDADARLIQFSLSQPTEEKDMRMRVDPAIKEWKKIISWQIASLSKENILTYVEAQLRALQKLNDGYVEAHELKISPLQGRTTNYLKIFLVSELWERLDALNLTSDESFRLDFLEAISSFKVSPSTFRYKIILPFEIMDNDAKNVDINSLSDNEILRLLDSMYFSEVFTENNVRARAVERVRLLAKYIDDIKKYIGQPIISVSVHGSYLYNPSPQDIDLHVVVEGEALKLIDHIPVKAISFPLAAELEASVKKIDITIIGQKTLEESDYAPDGTVSGINWAGIFVNNLRFQMPIGDLVLDGKPYKVDTKQKQTSYLSLARELLFSAKRHRTKIKRLITAARIMNFWQKTSGGSTGPLVSPETLRDLEILRSKDKLDPLDQGELRNFHNEITLIFNALVKRANAARMAVFGLERVYRAEEIIEISNREKIHQRLVQLNALGVELKFLAKEVMANQPASDPLEGILNTATLFGFLSKAENRLTAISYLLTSRDFSKKSVVRFLDSRQPQYVFMLLELNKATEFIEQYIQGRNKFSYGDLLTAYAQQVSDISAQQYMALALNRVMNLLMGDILPDAPMSTQSSEKSEDPAMGSDFITTSRRAFLQWLGLNGAVFNYRVRLSAVMNVATRNLFNVSLDMSDEEKVKSYIKDWKEYQKLRPTWQEPQWKKALTLFYMRNQLSAPAAQEFLMWLMLDSNFVFRRYLVEFMEEATKSGKERVTFNQLAATIKEHLQRPWISIDRYGPPEISGNVFRRPLAIKNKRMALLAFLGFVKWNKDDGKVITDWVASDLAEFLRDEEQNEKKIIEKVLTKGKDALEEEQSLTPLELNLIETFVLELDPKEGEKYNWLLWKMGVFLWQYSPEADHLSFILSEKLKKPALQKAHGEIDQAMTPQVNENKDAAATSNKPDKFFHFSPEPKAFLKDLLLDAPLSKYFVNVKVREPSDDFYSGELQTPWNDIDFSFYHSHYNQHYPDGMTIEVLDSFEGRAMAKQLAAAMILWLKRQGVKTLRLEYRNAFSQGWGPKAYKGDARAFAQNFVKYLINRLKLDEKTAVQYIFEQAVVLDLTQFSEEALEAIVFEPVDLKVKPPAFYGNSQAQYNLVKNSNADAVEPVAVPPGIGPGAERIKDLQLSDEDREKQRKNDIASQNNDKYKFTDKYPVKIETEQRLAIARDLDVDLRPIENGLLDVAYVGYAMAGKNIVNPDDKPLKVFYPGSGSDISSVLLWTNPSEICLVDFAFREPFAIWQSYLNHWDNLSVGEPYKFEKGYHFSGMQLEVARAAYLLGELKSLGVNREDILSLKSLQSDPNKLTAIEIKFMWGYHGQPKKERRLVILQQNITMTPWANSFVNKFMKDGIDVYFEKAGFDIRSAYPSFLPLIAPKISLGGFAVVDDNGLNFQRSLDTNGNKFTHVGEVESEEMRLWKSVMIDLNAYGRHMNIHQKWAEGLDQFQGHTMISKDRAMAGILPVDTSVEGNTLSDDAMLPENEGLARALDHFSQAQNAIPALADGKGIIAIKLEGNKIIKFKGLSPRTRYTVEIHPTKYFDEDGYVIFNNDEGTIMYKVFMPREDSGTGNASKTVSFPPLKGERGPIAVIEALKKVNQEIAARPDQKNPLNSELILSEYSIEDRIDFEIHYPNMVAHETNKAIKDDFVKLLLGTAFYVLRALHHQTITEPEATNILEELGKLVAWENTHHRRLGSLSVASLSYFIEGGVLESNLFIELSSAQLKLPSPLKERLTGLFLMAQALHTLSDEDDRTTTLPYIKEAFHILNDQSKSELHPALRRAVVYIFLRWVGDLDFMEGQDRMLVEGFAEFSTWISEIEKWLKREYELEERNDFSFVPISEAFGFDFYERSKELSLSLPVDTSLLEPWKEDNTEQSKKLAEAFMGDKDSAKKEVERIYQNGLRFIEAVKRHPNEPQKALEEFKSDEDAAMSSDAPGESEDPARDAPVMNLTADGNINDENNLHEIVSYIARSTGAFDFPQGAEEVVKQVYNAQIDPEIIVFIVKTKMYENEHVYTLIVVNEQTHRLVAGATIISYEGDILSAPITITYEKRKVYMQRAIKLLLKSKTIRGWHSSVDGLREPPAERMYDRLKSDPEINVKENDIELTYEVTLKSDTANAPGESEDPAMGGKAPGGIDLNPVKWEMKESGEKSQFDLPSTTNLPTTIDALYPVIINITPITNLPQLLGIADDKHEQSELSLSK